MTLAGIEPATFRFVAQHLKRCATAIPRWLKSSEYEADHELPQNAEVKDECSYTCIPPHALMIRRGIYSFLSYVMESTPVTVQSLDEEYL